MSAVVRSEEDVLKGASQVFGRGLLRVLASDPREAAERAYIARVTPSVDELEARIRAMQEEHLALAADERESA